MVFTIISSCLLLLSIQVLILRVLYRFLMVLALSMAEKIALVGREGKQFLALCRALQKQAANNGLKPSYIGEIARVLERLLEVNLVGYA